MKLKEILKNSNDPDKTALLIRKELLSMFPGEAHCEVACSVRSVNQLLSDIKDKVDKWCD